MKPDVQKRPSRVVGRLPVSAWSNPNHSAPIVGHGKSFASFGEVIQGRSSGGEDFLVTLPTDLWSTCELICSPIKGPLVVECALEKSRAALSHMLAELGIDWGYHFQCNFNSSIPIGKGLSSSTADMLATLRAVQEIFGFLLSDGFISRLFTEIEPHDGLQFSSSVLYNHRKGHLIENFGYVPNFTIVAVDDGGSLDTVTYNEKLSFSPDAVARFDALVPAVRDAFHERDDAKIARCATESARIHVERTGCDFLREALAIAELVKPLGIVATHSGTCAGFLFNQDMGPVEIAQVVRRLGMSLRREVFVTRTLHLLGARS